MPRPRTQPAPSVPRLVVPDGLPGVGDLVCMVDAYALSVTRVRHVECDPRRGDFFGRTPEEFARGGAWIIGDSLAGGWGCGWKTETFPLPNGEMPAVTDSRGERWRLGDAVRVRWEGAPSPGMEHTLREGAEVDGMIESLLWTDQAGYPRSASWRPDLLKTDVVDVCMWVLTGGSYSKRRRALRTSQLRHLTEEVRALPLARPTPRVPAAPSFGPLFDLTKETA